MTLNAYLTRFRSLKRLNHAMSWNGIFLSLVCIILTKQHGVRGGKYLLKTPGKAISETLKFKTFLDALPLKNLCLWCEFQSHLHLYYSLSACYLKNFDSPEWKLYEITPKKRFLLNPETSKALYFTKRKILCMIFVPEVS